MTDSMGPGKLVRHMQNLSYTYDTYLICMGLGPSTSSAIDKSLSYSGPSYPSLPVCVALEGLRKKIATQVQLFIKYFISYLESALAPEDHS